VARSAPSFSQAGEIIAAVLLAVAIAGLQVFIGGTRLAYALPVYALLGFAGLLAVLSLRTWRPAPDRLCLCSAALFFGYILIRAWFSPVSALSRPEIFSVLGGLIVYLGIVSVITDARWRFAILIFLVLVALIQVGIGAIQFRDGNNFMPISFLQRFDYGRRASGFFVCPNHFAGALEVLATFCFTIAFWSRWRVWGKLLIGYAGAICVVGLALTGSRGGYLSASASLLIAILLSLLALRKAGKRATQPCGGPSSAAPSWRSWS
jgi:hypothetical protein